MRNRFLHRKISPLGGWLTDLKNVAGDAVTGTVHIAAEAGRGTAAFATGDFDRAFDKAGSVVDTVGQGIDTTERIAGNLYDDAFGAKEKLNAPPAGYMYDDKTGELVREYRATVTRATLNGQKEGGS